MVAAKTIWFRDYGICSESKSLSFVYCAINKHKKKKFLVYKKGLDQVVSGYIRNVKKYKNIAESNQGKFIVGIQPAKHILELEEQIWITQPNREEVIHLLKDLYSELQQKARKQGFIVFNDLGEFEFADFVHTSESGSIKTAQVYSEKILQDFKEWNFLGITVVLSKRNYG